MLGLCSPSPSAQAGSESHSVSRVPWDGAGIAFPLLPPPRDTTSPSSPDSQRCKGHVTTDCFSRAQRCVRSLGSTENPCSADVVIRTFPVPLALSARPLFDFGLLGQVQICFQITPGYVAGRFSQEAAITRNSSCLSMLHRTGGSSAAPDGAFPPCCTFVSAWTVI